VTNPIAHYTFGRNHDRKKCLQRKPQQCIHLIYRGALWNLSDVQMRSWFKTGRHDYLYNDTQLNAACQNKNIKLSKTSCTVSLMLCRNLTHYAKCRYAECRWPQNGWASIHFDHRDLIKLCLISIILTCFKPRPYRKALSANKPNALIHIQFVYVFSSNIYALRPSNQYVISSSIFTHIDFGPSLYENICCHRDCSKLFTCISMMLAHVVDVDATKPMYLWYPLNQFKLLHKPCNNKLWSFVDF